MPDIDDDLRRRLDRLRDNGLAEARVNLPSDEELIDRLASLTGHLPVAAALPSTLPISPSSSHADKLTPGSILPLPTEPTADEIASLLKQVQLEVKLLPHEVEELDVVPVPPSTSFEDDDDTGGRRSPTFVDYTELILTSPTKIFHPKDDAAATATGPIAAPAAAAASPSATANIITNVPSSDVATLINRVAREVRLEQKYDAATAAEKGLLARMRELRSPSSSTTELHATDGNVKGSIITSVDEDDVERLIRRAAREVVIEEEEGVGTERARDRVLEERFKRLTGIKGQGVKGKKEEDEDVEALIRGMTSEVKNGVDKKD
ncbi:hypothetical protein HK101_001995 [Irineochytrium annulatum]|nr:hypothetical protein HK101_001995 [Irineochytrium annulatum]